MIQEKNYIIINSSYINIDPQNIQCCGENYYFTVFFDNKWHHLCYTNGDFMEGFYDKETEGLIYKKAHHRIIRIHLEKNIYSDFNQ